MGVEENNAKLLAACEAYFGEWAPYMITSRESDSFAFRSAKGKFPKLKTSRTLSVQSCYVKYSRIGERYDKHKKLIPKTFPAVLVVEFDQIKAADREIAIDASNVAKQLSQYFDLDVVATVCSGIKTRTELRQAPVDAKANPPLRSNMLLMLEAMDMKLDTILAPRIKSIAAAHSVPGTRFAPVQ